MSQSTKNLSTFSVASVLGIAVETLLIGILVLSPWALGCVHPYFELLLATAIGLGVVFTICRVLFTAADWWAGAFATLPQLLLLTALIAAIALPVVFSPIGMLPEGGRRAQLIDDLTPAATETLIDGTTPTLPEGTRRAGAACLNPNGNMKLVSRLALLACLILVTASVGKPNDFCWRLCVAAAVTGTCLAVFAIGQGQGGKNPLIYWTLESRGAGFGPFLNKNHYPFFANLLIGLNLGLLWKRREQHRFQWSQILQDPFSAALLIGLSIQVAAVFVSLSRAGVVSLVVALLVVSFVRRSTMQLPESAILVVSLAGLATLVFGWIGFDLVASRLSMLTDAEAYAADLRWQMWLDALDAFMKFPLFGTGGETYRYWETMVQHGDEFSSSIQTYAERTDNEYLDVLSEYGLFACLLLIAFAAKILIDTLRSARTDGFAAGLAFGLLAVSLHSCLDFGLRIPATGVLAAIVVGLACRLTYTRWQPQPTSYLRVQPVVAAALVIIVPVVTIGGFSDAARAEKARLEAWHRLNIGDAEGALSLAQQAVDTVSGNVELRIELARLGFIASQYERTAASSVDTVETTFVDVTEIPAEVPPEDNVAGAAADAPVAGEEEDSVDTLQAAAPEAVILSQGYKFALEQCILARELCPLPFEPAMWIYKDYDYFQSADERANYIAVAHRLHPGDPDLAYTWGQHLFDQGKESEAMRTWKESMKFSTAHVEQIVEVLRPEFDFQTILTSALPDSVPALLQVSRLELLSVEERQLALETALANSETWLETRRSRDLPQAHMALGEVMSGLGLSKRAVDQFRQALRFDSMVVSRRRRLASELIKENDLKAARNEIRILMQLEPGNAENKKLAASIESKLTSAPLKPLR